MYDKYHKCKCHRGGSFIASTEWKKKQTKKPKIATLNLVNGDDKCLQYVATVALNDEKNGKRPEVILKIKPFINTFT